MAMMFCPKCHSIMMPQRNDKGGEVLVCTKCGYTKPIEGSTVIKEKVEEKEMVVIEGDEGILPKTKIECPKCGNNEAYWRMEQTRAADEPETRIYRCTKCGYTWREY